jgi:hypothetical protein
MREPIRSLLEASASRNARKSDAGADANADPLTATPEKYARKSDAGADANDTGNSLR